MRLLFILCSSIFLLACSDKNAERPYEKGTFADPQIEAYKKAEALEDTINQTNEALKQNIELKTDQ